jgi:hypothetical protein
MNINGFDFSLFGLHLKGAGYEAVLALGLLLFFLKFRSGLK